MNYLDTLAYAIYHAEDAEVEVLVGEDWPLYRLYAVLALVKGDAVTCEDVHHAWVAWAQHYHPGHRRAVPFEALTPEVQALDQPYVDAIRQVVATRQGTGVTRE